MAVVMLSNSTLITAISFAAATFSGLSAMGAERVMISSNEDMVERMNRIGRIEREWGKESVKDQQVGEIWRTQPLPKLPVTPVYWRKS